MTTLKGKTIKVRKISLTSLNRLLSLGAKVIIVGGN